MVKSDSNRPVRGAREKTLDEPGANLVLVAKLIVMRTRKEYEIDCSPFTFGRSSENNVVCRSPSVSRRHGRVLSKEDGLYLEDLGSGNGTYLGDKLVTEPIRLSDGDTIRVEPLPGQPVGGWSATFRLWYRAVAD